MDALVADVLKALIRSVHGTTETAIALLGKVEDALKASQSTDTVTPDTQPETDHGVTPTPDVTVTPIEK